MSEEVGGLTSATTPLGGTELLHIVQSGNSRQTTVAALSNATILAANGALIAANDLSDLADAGTARTNLGLGTAATQNTGTSGSTVPLLNGSHTWSGTNTFSAAALFADGTAALPSVAFSADTDTGIYRSAADTIGISTAGASRFTINSVGTLLYTTVHGTTGSRFEIRKTDSITSYAASDAAFIVQSRRTDDETSSGVFNSGSILAFEKNANGPTDGLSSQAVWPNVRLVVANYGDSSTPGINMQGNLYATTEWDSGTLQAGSSTSATLQSGASASDDYYNGKILVVDSGTGSGQAAKITDYVGSTKVATIEDLDTGAALSTALDNTSVYRVIGYNELGGNSGTLINSGSEYGYMVAMEWLLQDGPAPSGPYQDTKMYGFAARLKRNASGSKPTIHFFASIEGGQASDAIVDINENSTAGVVTHLNMRNVNASSKNVLTAPNDHYIAFENTTGGLQQVIGLNSVNALVLKPGGATADIIFQDQGGSETMRLTDTNRVGIGTNNPSEMLDVNNDTIRLRTSKTPSSASDTGTQGQIAWDSSYFYICTATDTWQRVGHATW